MQGLDNSLAQLPSSHTSLEHMPVSHINMVTNTAAIPQLLKIVKKKHSPELHLESAKPGQNNDVYFSIFKVTHSGR
ncbi:MAG: hypothetical protein CMM16_05210 [Rhodospirillaceae bacterium]|nr:hypothetical protein [Rhodospirillaceae bacterium]